MKTIAALSMVKNEQDVIESFVRHVLSFCDVLLICDHHSTDKTSEILGLLQGEGLPLVIYQEDNPAHIQSEVMTRLAKTALEKYQADILLPLDGDEFLVPQKAEDIRSILESFSVCQLYRLPWRAYAPINWQEHIFVLQQASWQAAALLPGQKMIIGTECIRGKDFYIQEGNHNVILCQDNDEQVVPQVEQEQLELAHYCWRSPEQYAAKIMTTWPNIVAKYSRFTLSGSQYRHLFADLLANGMPSQLDLKPHDAVIADVAMKTISQELRYSHNTRPQPMKNLMEVSVRLAEALLAEKIIQRKKLVTIVIPYLGDTVALQNSLKEAQQQDYPYKEILLLEVLPAQGAREFVREINDEVPVKWVTYEAISQRAQGEYVQWLFPGDRMAQEKISKMLVVMESQDKMTIPGVPQEQSLALVVCESTEHGYFNQPADMSVGVRQAWWQEMCRRQEIPKTGIAVALIKRSLMEETNWLQGCYLEETPLLITMWWQLLTAAAAGSEQLLGIMKADYMASCQDEAWEEHFRQLEWQCLLEEEKRMKSYGG